MRCVSWLHPEAGDSNIVHYPISGKARRGQKMHSPMILSPYDCSYYQAVDNCQARTVDKRNFPMLGVKNMFEWFMALGARMTSVHFSVSNCLPWKPRLWQQSVWGGKCKVEGRGCKRTYYIPLLKISNSPVQLVEEHLLLVILDIWGKKRRWGHRLLLIPHPCLVSLWKSWGCETSLKYLLAIHLLLTILFVFHKSFSCAIPWLALQVLHEGSR